MGLFLKKRVEMPDKIILGNTEFIFDRKLGFHVGEWTVWDRKTKILLEFQSTEGNMGDIVLEKVNWVNDHKDTIIRAFLDENDDCIDVVNEMIEDGTLEADGKISEDEFVKALSSANDLLETITALYDRIVDKALLVRRLSISANRLLHEEKVPKQDEVEQLDLFTDYAAKEKQKAENAAEHARERKIQETILGIKKKFGKNAILKGLNLEDGATARERNQTIGGHQA